MKQKKFVLEVQSETQSWLFISGLLCLKGNAYEALDSLARSRQIKCEWFLRSQKWRLSESWIWGERKGFHWNKHESVSLFLSVSTCLERSLYEGNLTSFIKRGKTCSSMRMLFLQNLCLASSQGSDFSWALQRNSQGCILRSTICTDSAASRMSHISKGKKNRTHCRVKERKVRKPAICLWYSAHPGVLRGVEQAHGVWRFLVKLQWRVSKLESQPSCAQFWSIMS